jgi:hypothetical protein
MTRVMVRYTVHEDRAEENAALVQAVYAELAETGPAGFRYEAYRCDDGVTFVHLATSEGSVPLPEIAAFRRFKEGLDERCAAGPARTELREVGSYGGPRG